MKKKTALLAGTATLTGIAALALANNYQQWKSSESTRIQAESQLATTPLGTIEYGIDGSGPAVLVIHGSPGGYDQGLSLARWINSPDFTFISPSRPGYLHTPLSSGASPEEQADLFAALLDTLNIHQTAVLAVSGGGPSALQFALRHPTRCRGLLLLCAVAQRYVEQEVFSQLSLGTRLSKQLKNELILSDPFIYLLQALAKLQPGNSFNSEALASLSLPSLRKAGYRNDLSQYAILPAYPLEEISVPTFISQGTADTEVPFADAQLLASSIPHAQFIPVEGADHLFFLTHAEQVMPALRDFLHTLP
jgi:pimeloyl-ACP methyl ester carboxylesterase